MLCTYLGDASQVNEDDAFKDILKSYESIYLTTCSTKSRTTRFFRWFFDINKLLVEHSPNIIREDKDKNGVCRSIQSALDDLKHKNARRNRFTRWLIDLKPMIVRCEALLKEAHVARGMAFLNSRSSSNLECKKSTTAIIQQEIKSGGYKALSEHLNERRSCIEPLLLEETKELIPTYKINYFNPKPNVYRYVHPRVSGGKKMNYKHLNEEIQESYRERAKLQNACPPGYSVNEIDRVSHFKTWSDAVDDCEARESYARARIREKNPEIIFDRRHGKPSIAPARRR